MYQPGQRVGEYFQYNGLLGSFRYTQKRDMGDATAELPKFNMPAICPDCQVPMTHISRHSLLNPLHHYCNACGVVWQFTNMTCPDCGAICKYHTNQIEVVCCGCGEIYDFPFVAAYTDDYYQYGITNPLAQIEEPTALTYVVPEYANE